MLTYADVCADRFHAHLPALDGTARRMLDARLAQVLNLLALPVQKYQY
jgi:hypothetical protein